jgi:hypothetical protein
MKKLWIPFLCCLPFFKDLRTSFVIQEEFSEVSLTQTCNRCWNTSTLQIRTTSERHNTRVLSRIISIMDYIAM